MYLLVLQLPVACGAINEFVIGGFYPRHEVAFEASESAHDQCTLHVEGNLKQEVA